MPLSCRTCFVAPLGAVAAVVLAGAAQAQVDDDFSSGEDSRWTHFDPLAPFGAGGTWSFPPGAYRMQAPASPDPGTLGPQRIFSYRTSIDPIGAGTIQSVEIHAWNPDFRTSIGLFVSLEDIGVGTTDAVFAHIIVGGAGPDQIAIHRIDNEVVTLSISADLPDLSPDHNYRIGTKATGPGRLFFAIVDLADPSTILGDVLLVDPDPLLGSHNVGIGTFGGYDPGTGGYGNGPLDATFDNYRAIPAPSTGVLAVIGAMFAVRRRRG